MLHIHIIHNIRIYNIRLASAVAYLHNMQHNSMLHMYIIYSICILYISTTNTLVTNNGVTLRQRALLPTKEPCFAPTSPQNTFHKESCPSFR